LKQDEFSLIREVAKWDYQTLKKFMKW
jgi:hypothetical protein